MYFNMIYFFIRVVINRNFSIPTAGRCMGAEAGRGAGKDRAPGAGVNVIILRKANLQRFCLIILR